MGQKFKSSSRTIHKRHPHFELGCRFAFTGNALRKSFRSNPLAKKWRLARLSNGRKSESADTWQTATGLSAGRLAACRAKNNTSRQRYRLAEVLRDRML